MSPEDDTDITETGRWLDALDAVQSLRGVARTQFLLAGLREQALRTNSMPPFLPTTPYRNTIPPVQQARSPGDRAIEHRPGPVIRWNALAIILRANEESSELGGHIINADTGMPRHGRGPGCHRGTAGVTQPLATLADWRRQDRARRLAARQDRLADEARTRNEPRATGPQAPALRRTAAARVSGVAAPSADKHDRLLLGSPPACRCWNFGGLVQRVDMGSAFRASEVKRRRGDRPLARSLSSS